MVFSDNPVAGATILPDSGYLDPSDCDVMEAFSLGSVNGTVCKNTKFSKIAWNQVKPSSIDKKDAYLSNEHGTDVVKWRKATKTGLAFGYTSFLPINQEVLYYHRNNLFGKILLKKIK